MSASRSDLAAQRGAVGGRGATSSGPQGWSTRTVAPRLGAAALPNSATNRVGTSEDGDVEEEEDALVKITFKADAETLIAIDCLVANVQASTKVAQRRVRSEVIRRALIAAAAAVKLEHPAPRDKRDESDRGLTQSDSRSRRENDSFLDGDEISR